MRSLFMILIIASSTSAFSQYNNDYLRGGFGVYSILNGSPLYKVEVEYVKQFNRFVETGVSWNTGAKLKGREVITAHLDPNFYLNVLPFKRIKAAIGSGASFLFLSEEELFFDGTEFITIKNQQWTIGGNVILQTSFLVKENMNLVFRYINQVYKNNHLSMGISVNLSFKL